MAAANLTVARLRELLYYEPDTGRVRWALPQSNRVKPGEIAGSKTRFGYFRVGIDGKDYQVHRVAWALHYGEWPTGVIDHIDGDKTNNQAANLRDVSVAVNMQNRRTATSGTASGLLGATWHKPSRSWQARIKTSGQTISLGYFKTPEDAHAAYVAAKRKMHAGCTL